MKHYLITSVLVFSFQLFLNAQNFTNEFNKIGRDEVEMAYYAPDKTAEAVVLFDIGKSHFQRTEIGFDVIFERTTRIKVFNEAGIKWANVEIPFYQEGDIYEQVEDLEGNTYNFEEGQLRKTSLNISNCHNEKLNDSWLLKKFAMPDVKEGSILEYKYKIRSQYIFNLRDWEFQWKIPVIFSEYEVRMIPFYEYTFLLQGASKFDSQTSVADRGLEQQFGPVNFNDMIHKYGMKNVPAYKDEEYIASIQDNIIKLDFQLSQVTQINGATNKIMTTWPKLIVEMMKNSDFGGYARKSENMAEKLFDLKSLSVKPALEKYDSILNYVKANFSWNKQNRMYASKSPKDLLNDKFGNSADINLFTIGLLNAAGIKAYPVIISTRENGKVKLDYPFSSFFNYVIIYAEIDGKVVLSDATETLLANDFLPSRCLNDQGLIIQKEKAEWIGLQCLFPSKKRTICSVNVTDSTIKANINTYTTEYDGFNSRSTIGENIKNMQKELTEKGYSVADSSITIKNQGNIKEAYCLKYSINDYPERINGKIYISPFLHEIIKENPLTQQSRTNPIDMIYPVKRTYYAEINIPEGYKIDFSPADQKIKNDQFEMDYMIKSDEKKIIVSFVYYFKLPIYQATEYAKIKFYFNEIVDKGNEKLVFVKI